VVKERFGVQPEGDQMISSILLELQKELGASNLCEVEKGKYALSIRVGQGSISFLFNMSNVGEVEVFDPEHLIQQRDVEYVSLLEALSLILKKE
jgi:hypothetical protein